MRPVRFPLILFAMLGLGGCSLVVDFDRSLLRDGGTDSGADTSFDAASDGPMSGEEDVAVDGGADAG
jgi:hypothetical protein